MSGKDRVSRPQPGERVLLVDIGNTRIKWAVWQAGRLGRMQADEYAGWSSGDFERRIFRGVSAGAHGRSTSQRGRSATLSQTSVMPDRILVVSVAEPSVVRRFTAAARRAGAGAPGASGRPMARAIPELIATSRRAAGVATRYTEPWRLGVDRFLGVIAAHHLAGSRAACVINAGTAVTVDLVDARGVHHGGAILPGARLMMESLLRRTAGIARRARGVAGSPSRRGSASESLFALNTAAAIEQGTTHAVAGAVERGVAAACELLGAVPVVVATGGGAAELCPILRVRCIEVPDLVLRGIALHAGLALR